MLTVTVKIGGDEFSVTGEVPFTALVPVLTQWYQARDAETVSALQELTSDLKAENATEIAMVENAPPT